MKIADLKKMLYAAVMFAPAFLLYPVAISPAFATVGVAPVGAENPYLKEIETATKELGEALEPDALKHLYYIREGFGATRAVKIVRKDVAHAVMLCGKENPDLKADIDAEFKAWSKAVDPVLKDKEALMKQAIDQQDYSKPKEIRDYLSLIEKAGEHANKQVDKQVVTTPEACNDLKKSMTRTQEALVDLLGEVQFLVWPLPAEQ